MSAVNVVLSFNQMPRESGLFLDIFLHNVKFACAKTFSLKFKPVPTFLRPQSDLFHLDALYFNLCKLILLICWTCTKAEAILVSGSPDRPNIQPDSHRLCLMQYTSFKLDTL